VNKPTVTKVYVTEKTVEGFFHMTLSDLRHNVDRVFGIDTHRIVQETLGVEIIR
jgi:hypothetical protein